MHGAAGDEPVGMMFLDVGAVPELRIFIEHVATGCGFGHWQRS
jgi:hypothetical protein